MFGAPDYEKRDIEVSQVDLDILLRANELLSDEAEWTKDPIRDCQEFTKLSLYCTLVRASVEIAGDYVHRKPALQEVRFVIDDYYKSRWNAHRLADFNAHPDTSFEDIKSVISMAIDAVSLKLGITSE